MTKKNRTWLFALAGVASLSVVTLFSVATFQGSRIGFLSNADLEYSMILDRDTELLSQDHGFYHAATVKGSEFDFLGYSPVEGKLGNIKKKNYNGVYDYNGIVYNRSLINGFKTLTVTFTGAKLYYALTSFLMEDMTFDKANEVVSGTPIEAKTGDAYFILYTDDTDTGVTIEDLVLTYRCNGDIDATMLYDKNSTLGGARSISKTYTQTDSFLETENNPTATTNNYSTGSHGGHADTWYRWNGRFFRNTDNLGTEFDLNMTILGNISQAVDPSWHFNYSVWPRLITDRYDPSKSEYDDANNGNVDWVMTYIGDDNYDPRGYVEGRQYTDEAYTGRFFTYGGYEQVGEDEWVFHNFYNPDTTKISDNSMTLREAFEANTLPFWYLNMHFYTIERVENKVLHYYLNCDVSINNMPIYTSEELLELTGYDDHVYISAIHCHNVNYGHVEDPTQVEDSYKGVFTYPRLG